MHRIKHHALFSPNQVVRIRITVLRIRVCMRVMRIQLPLFTSMCFRILIFTLMRYPDPIYHFDADADPDPAPHQSDANPRPRVYRPSTAPF